MPPFEVTIRMSPETVRTLGSDGFVLGGLAGARCAMPGGLPALLFATARYGLSTRLFFDPVYLAYASEKPVVDGGVISVSGAYAVEPGHTFQVAGPTGTVGSTGVAGQITIANTTQVLVPSAGLSLAMGLPAADGGSASSPPSPVTGSTALCGFPLAPAGSLAITPLPLLFLVMWRPWGPTPPPGTALSACPGAGVLLDLGANPAPALTYTATPATNPGWSWDGAAAGITAHGVGHPLAALLNPPSGP